MAIRTTYMLAVLAILMVAPVLAAGTTVEVSVDCGNVLDTAPVLWGHVNVSRRAPPPPELCALIRREFGLPTVTRCWLLLDQMWDYRTNTYRFDYEINKDYYVGDPKKKKYGVQGVTTGLRYYQYIDSVARHSQHVLLNIRRYEPEVLAGMVPLTKWKEVFKAAVRHYKKRCPNLRYIEVLNEPTAKNQSNIGSMKNYYRFYRVAYQAINELNAELKPRLPLLVGGTSGFRTDHAIHLARDFANDTAANKRLDFLSFHHYWAGGRPAQVAEWEGQVDRALARLKLPTDLPIFVTEIGYAHDYKDNPAKNHWQACGMTAYQYYARQSPNLRLFPWVQYHSKKQIAFVQFDTDLTMTPYGAAVKMLRMHRSREVNAHSNGVDKNGNGVNAIATIDDAGLTVQVWNLEPTGKTSALTRVSVKKRPADLRKGRLVVRRYLIDSKHSNHLMNRKWAGGLQLVETFELDGAAELSLNAKLEPMAICLWEVNRKKN